MIRGPRPHGSVTVADGASVCGIRPLSAGMDSRDSPTGSCTGWPVAGWIVVAYCTVRKLMLIWFVVSGGTISVSPSKPTLAKRTPFGLVILIDAGAAAKPGTDWMTMRLIVRMPCQLSLSTGLGPPAIHAPGWPGRNRFLGDSVGSDPKVELAVTSRVFLRTGLRLLSSASRPGPGRAMAAADNRNDAVRGVTKVRSSGA